MAVENTAANVLENGTTNGDVTSDVTTINRILSYTNRAGVVVTNTPIVAGAGGTQVLTQYGTLTIHQDGTYTYVADAPAANALDTGNTVNEVFTYDFGDPTAVDDGSTTIQVIGVNDAPDAVNDGPYAATEDGGSIIIPAPGVLGNDTDPDDPLFISGFTQGAHGTVSVAPDGSFTYTPAANYNGPDSFTYTLTDDNGATDTATVSINVAPDGPLADPYVAVDDGQDPNPPGEPSGFTPFLTQAEDVTHTYTIGTVGGAVGDGNFLANDQNPDNDPIVVQSISNLFDATTNALVGTVTYNFAGQTYTITPNGNYNGDAYFDYVAADTQGTASTADDQVDQGRVFVRVTPVNDAPVLGDGPGAGTTDGQTTATGTEDAIITGMVPAATDTEGNAITYVLEPGSVQRNGVTIANPAAEGFTFNSDGTYSYNPTGNAVDQALDDNPAEHNTITFQYRAVDNGSTGFPPVSAPAQSTLGSGTITVNGVNDAPMANDDTYSATEDTTLPASASRNVLTNDTDVDGDNLTVIAASGNTVGGGTYQIFSNGTFTYTPQANDTGTDSFDYTVTDGDLTDTATVFINVGNTADAPTANDDGPFNVTEDVPNQAQGLQPGGGAFRTNANGFFDERQLTGAPGSTTGATTPGGTDTDPDAGAPANLDITSVGAAQGGTVTLFTSPGGTQFVVFTPFANYSGPAGFDYAVTDPQGNSDIGHVTLAVQEATDGGPTAVDDTLNGTEQTVLHITAAQLVSNDTDPDNNSSGAGTDQLVVRAIQNIQNATLSNVVTDGNGNIISFDLTPNSDVNGAPTSFDYVVDDSAARANVTGDTAAPGAIGGPRTVGAPDVRSGTDIGSVTINVTNVNDQPDAVNDTLPGTTEDSSTGINFTAAQLLANDHDADNNGNTNAGLTATIPTGAVNGGTITFNSGTGQYTFIPSANFNGNATFTYTVTDSGGLTDSATVTIPVTPVNDNPVANPDVLTQGITLGQPVIAEDRPTVFSFAQFLANDTDVDIARGEGGQSPLFISGATSPQGTLTIDQGARTVTFTPTPGFSGPASITYVVSDQAGGTANGTATFTVIDTVVGGGTGETLGAANNGQSTVILGNGGNDTLNGTPQTDELYGNDGNDTLNGLGANDFLRGGTGNDTANGGDGNDTIYADDGGTDTSNGDAGNDGIFYGAALDATDTVHGGTGSDTLALRGNYGTGPGGNSYFFSATNLSGDVETLFLASGSNTTSFPAPGGTTPGPFDYFLTEQDSNVAAGQTLTIVANGPNVNTPGLQAGEDLYFDGSDEKDGSFRIFAGHGNDRLIGGQQADGFFFETGAFTGADQVDGRGGTDTLALRGDYSGGVTLNNVINTEIVSALSGHTNQFGGAIVPGGYDYDITLATGNVTTGGTIQVNGANLQSDETLTVDAHNIFGGSVSIFGGAGNDDLSGGRQSTPVIGTGGTDLLVGGLGGDRMDGGRAGNGGNGDTDGSNVYLYRTAAESNLTGSNGFQSSLDHIQGFNYQLDKIDINQGGGSTNGFTGGITGLNVQDVNAVFGGSFTDTNSSGNLEDSEFLTQLASQLDNALGNGEAAFLQVTTGTYAGSTIFVADTDHDGLVSGSDLIIVFDNLQGQLPPSPEFIM